MAAFVVYTVVVIEMYFWFWMVNAVAFGLIIGSFLNVFIYRFHTGKSLAGSSHCLSCAKPLRWYELVPVVSYVALRGKCKGCGSRIPSRYVWVELATAVLFGVLVWTVSDMWLWPLLLFLIAVLLVVTVYDMYHLIIPDSLVVVLTGIAVVHQGYAFYTEAIALDDVLWSLVAGVASFGFFAALWWYSAGRWLGFGDAKLAFPLGILVGGGSAFSVIVLAFWVGTLISLSIIAWQSVRVRGQSHLRFLPTRLTIKSEVPFAPFLIIGFILVYFFGVDVLTLTSYVM